MTDEFLTTDELAEKLKVPKSWVYARTRERGPRAIPKLKFGKYCRFEWPKVKQWLEKINETDI